MAFSVTFYNFTKEENSTKRPATGGRDFNCKILRGSGLINPTIELNIGLTTAPEWNYCFIPSFNRYYYVAEWYFDSALWKASLECDVLATYRTEIGSSNLYALRASNSYDGRIPDNMYPTKAGCTFSSSAIESPWSGTDEGVVVVGIVGKNPDFGSLNYYALNIAGFATLLSELLDDSLLSDSGFDEADASLALQKSIVDPLQYIKSAVYIPRPYNFGEPIIGGIDVWNWSITGAGGRKIRKASPFQSIGSVDISIPKHPQAGSRGSYCNQSPYSIYELVYPPFGVIELDSTVLCNASNITVNVSIDFPTGLGIMTVTCNGIILNRIEAQIGVPVQLSQVTRDYLGGVSSIIQGVTGVIGSALSGNIAGAINSGVSGIGNAVTALTPRSQTIGSGGSYAQLYQSFGLYAQFFEIVNDDINKNGRPLCQIVQPGEVGGYFLIQDGDVEINGTAQESQRIREKLESGFYWE